MQNSLSPSGTTMNAPGFTLVEVLIVVAIMAILASMAMPILTVARRAANTSATRSVMHKLDTALKLFRADVHTFPYQRTYADTSAGERPTNRLYHHLGTTLTAAEVVTLYQDGDAAAGQYAYPCGVTDGAAVEQAPVSPHVFVSTDIKPSASTNGNTPPWSLYDQGGGVLAWRANRGNADTRMATCVMLNRMAAERVCLAVWSGNIDVTGCRQRDAIDPTGAVFMIGRDQSGSQLLTVKRSEAKPGWGSDYLAGELEPRYIDGETVLDAWRRPIVYICQVVEGMRGTRGVIFKSNLQWIDARLYGLGKQGRRTLAAIDPDSGEAITADAATLPDVTDLMNSDRRSWAAPGREYGYELWSAGPDGDFDWMRPDHGNRDNVGLEAYDQDIVR